MIMNLADAKVVIFEQQEQINAMRGELATLRARCKRLEAGLKRIALKRLDAKPGHYCESRSALDGAIALAEQALAALKEPHD